MALIILTNTGAGLKWTVPADWNNDGAHIIAFGGGQAGMTPSAANSLSGFGGGSGFSVVRNTPSPPLVPGQMLDYQIGAKQFASGGATVVTPAVTDADMVNGGSSVSALTWAPGNPTWLKKADGSHLVFAPGGGGSGVVGSGSTTGSNGTLIQYLTYAYMTNGSCGNAGLKMSGAGGGGAGAPGDPWGPGVNFLGGYADTGNYPGIAIAGDNCHIASITASKGVGGGAGVTGMWTDPDGGDAARKGLYGAAGHTASLGGNGGAPGVIGSIHGSPGSDGGAYYVSTIDSTFAGPGGGGGGGAGGLVYEFDTGTRFVNPPPWGSRQKADVVNTLFGPANGGNGGDGGKYSGGGGGGANAATLNQSGMGIGGAGAQGFIVITYTPADTGGGPTPEPTGRNWVARVGPIRV